MVHSVGVLFPCLTHEVPRGDEWCVPANTMQTSQSDFFCLRDNMITKQYGPKPVLEFLILTFGATKSPVFCFRAFYSPTFGFAPPPPRFCPSTGLSKHEDPV